MIPARFFFFGLSLQLDILIVAPCKPQTFLFFNTRSPRFSLNISPDTAPRFSEKRLTILKCLSFLDPYKNPWTTLSRHSANLNHYLHPSTGSPATCLMWFHSSFSPYFLLTILKWSFNYRFAISPLIPTPPRGLPAFTWAPGHHWACDIDGKPHLPLLARPDRGCLISNLGSLTVKMFCFLGS